MWRCLQLFVDQRSQEKLKFIAKNSYSKSLPHQIVDMIDPDLIPVIFGGNFAGPLADIRATFSL